jgi:acyl-CoA synthetase (AMP-forming)/AMP-acid ligase II
MTTRSVTARQAAWASRRPDRPALTLGTETITHGQLRARIEQVAAAAQAGGLRPRDLALVFMPHGIDAVICYFGLMEAGVVPSFMPLPSAKQDPARYWAAHAALLELLRPAAVIGPDSQLAEMRAAGLDHYTPRLWTPQSLLESVTVVPSTHEPAVDDIALLQHSSGTTALKKGVALSHRAILAQVDSYARAIAAGPEDVVVSWLPMYHDMGLIACTVMPLMLGQHVVMLDPFEWVADPQRLFAAITRHRGTLTWLPNFAFELLARTVKPLPEFDLSSMRAFIDCSEPCKPRSFTGFGRRFAGIGVRRESLQVCYAMAETVFGVTQTRIGEAPRVLEISPSTLAARGEATPAHDGEEALPLLSAGRPIEGIEVWIADEAGHALPDGRVGEIELRGAFLFDGYHRREALTKERFRDGRYRTHDLGFLQEGELYVLGRSDDLIIVHGRNYFAHEIEAAVNDVRGLKPGRNVAIPVFNELLSTQEVVLIAESDPGAVFDELELKRRVKAQVLQAMGLDLRDVSIVPPGWLVKTSSGKISRGANKDKYLQPLTTA